MVYMRDNGEIPDVHNLILTQLTFELKKFIMKKMRKSFWGLLVVFLSAQMSWGISADLGEVGVGARPLSLGKAYTGYSQDGSAIFTNPAGLGVNPAFKFMSMTGKLLEDITYVSCGISNPYPLGTLGVGYISAATSSIPLTTLLTYPTGTYEVVPNGVTDYSSSVLYLSYGKEFIKDLALGANLKLYNQGFSLNSGSMEGASGSGMDMDLGLNWKFRPGFSAGALLKNILPMSLGGKFTWKRNNVEEGIAGSVLLGLEANLLGAAGLYQYRDQEVYITLDAELNPTLKRPGLWHAGAEWWMTPLVALRAGIDQKAKATETGVGVDNNLTAGLGLKYQGFSFDYAYHQYGELTENTTHFFSLGFTGLSKKSKYQEMIEEKKEIPKELIPKVKPKTGLKTFLDVPEDYWAAAPIGYLATLAILGGYPDDTFKPDEPLTRAELAAILVRAKGFPTPEVVASLFPDVERTHWAAPYIEVAMDRKYVSGYPDGKFYPWKKVTRAEAVVVMLKFAGLTEPLSLTAAPFPDLPKRHWAARAASVAKTNGLLEYLSGKDFEPDKPLTRAEAAEIISKTEFAKEKIEELLKK